ncbi:MAG: hypothetical protein HOJ35_09140 [Bdellovibrionales bacterium]|jgi:hypothetical protein|nr:hypothetical protein [Bdellovibrionales bacterium]
MIRLHLEQVNQTSNLLLEFIDKYSDTKYSSYIESLINELDELETQYEEMMRFEYRQEIMDWWRELKVLWKARQIIEEYSSKVEKELKKRK